MPTGTDVALARISEAAYLDVAAGLPTGFAPLAAGALGLSVGAGESYAGGVYRNANAAALVLTGTLNGSPTLVLAFRGSDDREDAINSLRNINADYPDFAKLVAAVDAYAIQAGFGQVAVTGHSLGGAMAQLYLAGHPDTPGIHYAAATFGSPGALITDGPDPRVTNFRIADDPAVFLGENRRDVGAELRSNPFYAAIAISSGADALPGLTELDVLDSLPSLTRDYENRGVDYVLPRADGTLFLLQDLEDLADADPAEHRVTNYVAKLSTLTGSNGDDQATGGPGNDRLTGTLGNDVLDGGGGKDYVDLTTISVRASTVLPGAGGTVHQHGGQTDVYRNTEEIRFLDGRLVLDVDDAAAKVSRLYDASLKRAADQGGLNFWTDSLNAGTPLDALSASFLGSAEFIARYGTLDNGGYVDLLYQNVLGRAPDADGRAFWTNTLTNGTPRASVLSSFSESPESKALAAPLLAGGIWDRDETAATVARLYDTAFSRLPDLAGLSNWKANLDSNVLTLSQVAEAFYNSAEFQTAYGALGTQDFVATLYANALDRPADQTGLDYWSSVVNTGALSRSATVLTFSESTEHQQLSAANVGGETPATYGIRFLG